MINIKKKKVDLIAFDFDGVFTNNQALIFEDGSEAVFVNRSDGLAISKLRETGFKMIIISSEKNNVVKTRAQKLNIPVINGVINKKEALLEYCFQEGFDIKKTIFVGNDINDKEVMMSVGIPICPNDAYSDIKKISKIILTKCGGEGVIRELMEMILQEYR